jgi:hypothetical protein
LILYENVDEDSTIVYVFTEKSAYAESRLKPAIGKTTSE